MRERFTGHMQSFVFNKFVLSIAGTIVASCPLLFLTTKQKPVYVPLSCPFAFEDRLDAGANYRFNIKFLEVIRFLANMYGESFLLIF